MHYYNNDWCVFLRFPSTQNDEDSLMKNRLNIAIHHSPIVVIRNLKFHRNVYAEDTLRRKKPVYIILVIRSGTLLGLYYVLILGLPTLFLNSGNPTEFFIHIITSSRVVPILPAYSPSSYLVKSTNY